MSARKDPYRMPSDWERRLLVRLVEPEFPGRDVLRDQIDHVLVSPIDENGSLDLKCDVPAVAPVEKRVPTEGEAIDRDGTTIHYLLHVVAGRMKELEVYKDDSSRVLEHPSPEDVVPLILGAG
jgi:hypothetical protein